jgi:hypothetical protein
MEGHVPVFISPRSSVAQLCHQSLGSLFVAFYVSQGYSYRLSLYRLRTDHIENISYSCSILLYALPNELFTKILSPQELVYRVVA